MAHLKPIIDYWEGETFAGDSLVTRYKNAKDNRYFYASHLITLPRAKIRGREYKPSVTQEITANKFLTFAKTVLLKARLNARGRALMLTMLQSGTAASTTLP